MKSACGLVRFATLVLYFVACLHLSQVRTPRPDGRASGERASDDSCIRPVWNCTAAKTRALEREWSRYRDQQGHDLYGKSQLFENLDRDDNECSCERSTMTPP